MITVISGSIKIPKPNSCLHYTCIIQNPLEHEDTDCRPTGWRITKNLLLLRSRYPYRSWTCGQSFHQHQTSFFLSLWRLLLFECIDPHYSHELLAAAWLRCIWGSCVFTQQLLQSVLLPSTRQMLLLHMLIGSMQCDLFICCLIRM